MEVRGKPVHKITTVLEIISSISSTLALSEILAEFTEKMAQIVGADSCTISRWDRKNGSLVVLADYVSPQVKPPFNDNDDVTAVYTLAHYPAMEWVLQKQTPLIVYVDDPTADEAEKDLLRTFQRDGILMVPMLCGGQATGLLELYIDDKGRYQFIDDDITLCQTLANQVAVAIENTRLYQEAKEGRLQAEAMQVISQVLASELDYQRIVHNVADLAYSLVGARLVCVAILETEGFRPVAIIGRNQSNTSAIHFINASLNLPGQGLLARIAQGPVIVPDIQHDPTFTLWQAEARAQGWRAMVTVPLFSRNRMMGVLAAYAHQANFFEPNNVAILMPLASQAAVAIQNAQLFTELEAQRERLHQVSLRLVNAQEEERRRISRKLHDELGQALTALKINLDMARRALPADKLPRLHRSIHEARSLAVQTLETARDLSLELHPAMLDDLGLVSALRWEIDRYEQRTGQTIHIETDLADVMLQPELEITIYRIITEALTNVARHAQAKHILVYLRVENHQVVAGVEDDGLGFDAVSWFNSPAERQSLGLVSMHERAELLQGQLAIISEPGQGTKVRVQLPFDD